METGVVKWFDDDKGYGYITADSNGEQVFAHHSHIDMDGFQRLEANQRVSYEVKAGQKGNQAANIRPL